MSTYGNGNSFGGSSFYSEPHPENIGSPRAREDETFRNAHESPRTATPPPYTDYAPQDDGSFAPATMVDPEVREAAAAYVEPPSISIPMIAAGAFVLWLLFKGDA